ncbi:MAG: hypothetical protein L0338_29445 [Acidobacteria bacterium]|nr:hypothetical protein [Acidobacteriota bacterium]
MISVATYYLVLNYVASPLHDWIDEGAKEITSETAVMFQVFGIYVLAGGLLILCGILFDYAKIIIVAEDRRSVLGSCIHSVRFVLKHPINTVLLYLVLLLASGLVMLLYALAAPGPEQASWFTLVMAFALGQAYLIARLFCKLSFLACQSRLFRSKVKPADFTGLPKTI